MNALQKKRPGAGACPACQSASIHFLQKVEGYAYFQCSACTMLFIDPIVLDEIDQGFNVRKYDDAYWDMEISAAKERANGVALARMAEAILYTRIPVQRFIDVGTGPGYFLDAVARYLPSNSHRFFGIEKFPPPPEERSKHQNYLVGDLDDVSEIFDSGFCMEVVEHLTPTMMRALLVAIATRSNPGACYIVNTGLSDFVIKEQPEYLDPVRRGHIVSWSVPAVRALSDGLPLNVHTIPGKTWAFALEKRLDSHESAALLDQDIRDRYWSALPENKALLNDPVMGSVIELLGHHTIFAFQ